MLFNSFEFAIFFIVVYGLYLALPHRWQNRMLLMASYVFYGAWDWRFLSLIFISTVIDYLCGIKISGSDDIKRKRLFLFFSIAGNLSILGFFKYFDFFAFSFQSFLSYFGFSVQPHFLHIILPVGISFYTFQSMSYTIDIYRNQMEPTRSFFDFALFVAFFPQLVAGPIERARRLLPQVCAPRTVTLDKFYEGGYLIFWGLFLKVFIADNLARIVDPIFASGPPYNGAMVLVGLYGFAFQILCDFAGYSNIARGLGKCLGFDIMVNFNLPYFATSPREFWQRWHISLSTWLRDYLYIPLGGNRRGRLIAFRNVGITMLLGGLWHGADWTFILWGAYHGILLVIHRLLDPLLKNIPSPQGVFARKLWTFVKTFCFFHLICLGWLLFRARSVDQAFSMGTALFSNFDIASATGAGLAFQSILSLIWLLVVMEIFQYIKNDAMIMVKANFLVRAVFYSVCFYLVVIYGATGGKEFIYFQF